MAYVSDRTRVEIGLPIHMMLGAFIAGVEDQTSEEFKQIRSDLILAANSVVDDMIDKKAVSILNRTTELHKEVTAEYVKEQAEVSKLGLIMFHFIRYLIEDHYLVYEENGPFDKSITAFMEALEHKAQEGKVNDSAIRQARKMLKRLQDKGYYQGVAPND